MVQVNPGLTTLILRYQVGTDASGGPILRNQSYRGVKPGAGADNLYAAAEAIAGLQVNPLYAVDRVERDELIKQ
ncbi:MAG: DUF1659 domain-containing protein [Alicyclobacillaceae bacterium]|nr:DUF1659 domain-containing protein [Alicyclobacillaceae bacterium]